MTRHVICRYTDQDYDSEFIEILQTQCFSFIKQAGEASLDEVSAFIHDKVCRTCCTFYRSENLAKTICWGCFSTAISIVDIFIASSSQKLFYSRKSD